MWLLPSSLYSAAPERCRLDLESQQTSELWVTVSGTPMRRPLSWRGWKTRRWIERLFGAAILPSWTPPHFSAWISSPPRRRASRTLSPELDAETPTIAATETETDLSLICYESSGKCGHVLCSLRTFRPGSQADIFSPSVSAYSTWVTESKDRSSWLRRMLARHTSGSESLYWPTPVANDDQKSPEAHLRMKTNMKGGPRTQPTSLNVVSKIWQTPTQPLGGRTSRSGDRKDELLLDSQEKQWATPRTQNQRDTKIDRGQCSLEEQIHTFQAQANAWPTESATDYKGATTCDPHRPPNGQRLDQFTFHSFRPDPKNTTDGATSSPSTRRLNPRFVEWLMQWPIGWTDCAAPATEWSRWWSLSRGQFYRLMSGNDAPKMPPDGLRSRFRRF